MSTTCQSGSTELLHSLTVWDQSAPKMRPNSCRLQQDAVSDSSKHHVLMTAETGYVQSTDHHFHHRPSIALPCLSRMHSSQPQVLPSPRRQIIDIWICKFNFAVVEGTDIEANRGQEGDSVQEHLIQLPCDWQAIRRKRRKSQSKEPPSIWVVELSVQSAWLPPQCSIWVMLTRCSSLWAEKRQNLRLELAVMLYGPKWAHSDEFMAVINHSEVEDRRQPLLISIFKWCCCRFCAIVIWQTWMWSGQ